MTNPADDLFVADAILVIGSNTTENHPVIGWKIRKAVAAGTKLLVFDPRRIALTRIATVWGRQRPGTDVALVNGLMHVILKEGLADRAFIEERTEGFADLARVVEVYTPERVAETTGIEAQTIVEAARIYATAKAASIVYSMGITQHTTGVDAVRSLANLAMVAGQIGRPGTGVNPLRGQNNVQGACDMGALPNVFSGYQSVADEKARAKFEAAWGVRLPDKVGLTATQMMPAALEGKVRAMYIMGENPVLSEADSTHVEKALLSLEFLVVQDIFMTETAKLAHVVLPATSFAERDGTYTNTERRVQLTEAVVPAPGEARRDWEIVCEVASRLGTPMRYASTREVADEMRSLTPSYAGISWARLEGGKSLSWPCPAEDHPGTPILHVGRFPRGKGLFAPIEWKPPAEVAGGEFPFTLTTGRILEQYHTRTMTGRTAVDALEPDCFVEVNEADARKLRVGAGSPVRVVTRRGAVSARVRMNHRVAKGTIFMPFHYAKAAANRLTNPAFDPIAKIPEFKVCAARLEKP